MEANSVHNVVVEFFIFMFKALHKFFEFQSQHFHTFFGKISSIVKARWLYPCQFSSQPRGQKECNFVYYSRNAFRVCIAAKKLSQKKLLICYLRSFTRKSIS